jgi:hypothetical protein
MESVNVSSTKMIFGFGKITITVLATCDEGVVASKTADGFVFLFFITMNT